LSYNNPSQQQPSIFGGGAAAAPAAAPAGGADLMTDRGQAPFDSAQGRPARVGGDDVIKTVKREEPKIGRNDPCWCGSGKKFKKCHGA
jgi:preprotein translocase subunit SecA